MKYSIILLAAFLLTYFNSSAQNKTIIPNQVLIATLQEEEEEKDAKKDFENEVDEDMKFYKEKYEVVYPDSFHVVFNAVKQAMKDIGCMISYENIKSLEGGVKRGTINSDFCVFVEGYDSAFTVLKRYSQKRPFTKESKIFPLIRGGVWQNGRMQYKISIKEQLDKKVYLLLKGEISGYERKATYLFHFWDSNGILETQMLERIQHNINLSKK